MSIRARAMKPNQADPQALRSLDRDHGSTSPPAPPSTIPPLLAVSPVPAACSSRIARSCARSSGVSRLFLTM